MIPPPARHLLRRRLSLSTSSSPASSSSRSLSSTPRLLVRQADEWTYPSKLGDNKPRRPFLNPDVSDQIPNVVAIRNGLPPYRLPSASLDIFELPPTLPIEHDILTHTITFLAYEREEVIPYIAMARHCALALSIPMTGPNFFRPDIKRYAVNKSPFVHSASKEVYQRVTYKVQMDVWDAHDKAVEVMLKVILASGRGQHVRVKVEKYSLGSLDFDAVSSTTAPLTRDHSIVQEIADRFVKESLQEASAPDENADFVRALREAAEQDTKAEAARNSNEKSEEGQGEEEEIMVVPEDEMMEPIEEEGGKVAGEGEEPAFDEVTSVTAETMEGSPESASEDASTVAASSNPKNNTTTAPSNDSNPSPETPSPPQSQSTSTSSSSSQSPSSPSSDDSSSSLVDKASSLASDLASKASDALPLSTPSPSDVSSTIASATSSVIDKAADLKNAAIDALPTPSFQSSSSSEPPKPAPMKEADEIAVDQVTPTTRATLESSPGAAASEDASTVKAQGPERRENTSTAPIADANSETASNPTLPSSRSSSSSSENGEGLSKEPTTDASTKDGEKVVIPEDKVGDAALEAAEQGQGGVGVEIEEAKEEKKEGEGK